MSVTHPRMADIEAACQFINDAVPATEMDRASLEVVSSTIRRPEPLAEHGMILHEYDLDGTLLIFFLHSHRYLLRFS